MSDTGSESGPAVSPDGVNPQVVLGSLADPALLVDRLTGEIAGVNDHAKDLFDCPEETLVGRELSAFVPCGETDQFLRTVERVRGAGRTERYENGNPIQVETVTGESRPVSLAVGPLETDSVEWDLVHLQDISAQRDREQALRATTARLETLLTAAPVPFVILDTDGVVERWNHAATETFGWSASGVIGEQCSLFPPQSEGLFEQVLDGEIVRGVETVLEARDGSLLEVELYAQPMEMPDGRTCLILSAIDVTDLKQREQHLSVLHRVLRHNLRNKLNVIHASANQLSEEFGDDAKPHSRRLLDATADLIRLGEQAQQIARDIDQTTADPAPIALTALLGDLQRQFSTDYPAMRLTVTDIPQEEVYIPAMTRVVLEELVGFAFTHSDRSEPAIEITASVDTRVRVTVADDGPEMADGERALIEDGKEGTLLHGDGLSLARVYMLVTALGGTVDIEERAGRGTVVHVELPRLAGGVVW